MTDWLKVLLEHAGYEVRTALIGARGEELFRTWRPDAVVTDKSGRQITDLETGDFEILEDGRPQKITNFSYISGDAPATTGVS